MKMIKPSIVAICALTIVTIASCSDSDSSGDTAAPAVGSTSGPAAPESEASQPAPEAFQPAPEASQPATPAPEAPQPAPTVGGQSEVPADSAAGPEVTTADSSLGEIVVDGQGLTAYMFTKDTQGSATSACTGECVGLWPAITSTAQTPIVDGVTGEIGTIPTANGQNQITVNGWPIYTYAGDQAPGDVTGQNVNGIWFVMSPDGKPIKDATDSAMSY